MDPEPPNRKRTLLIAAVLAVIVLVAAGFFWLGGGPETREPQGHVTINYALADTTSVTVRLNGEVVENVPTEGYDTEDGPSSKLKTDFDLAPGDYEFSVSKPGYTDFSTRFSLGADQSLLINAVIQPTAAPTVTSPQQLTLYPGMESGTTILGTQYFYDNTWAVTTINAPDYPDAVVVLQSNPSGGWTTVLGPGAVFHHTSISWLPTLIQDYLNNNNRVAWE